MTKKTFHIADMHCSACAMTLEGLEDELTGVKTVNASYHKQQIEVEFDESKVTEANIIASVKDMGYTAVLAGG